MACGRRVIVAAAVFGILFVAASRAMLPPSTFEGNDAMWWSTLQVTLTGRAWRVSPGCGRWERAAAIGDAHIDFELNQNATLGLDSSTTGIVQLNRTPGDLLISYDFSGSGTPTITVYTSNTTDIPMCSTTTTRS